MRAFIIITLFGLFFSSCTDPANNAPKDIDPEIIGLWMQESRGFRFHEDGKMELVYVSNPDPETEGLDITFHTSVEKGFKYISYEAKRDGKVVKTAHEKYKIENGVLCLPIKRHYDNETIVKDYEDKYVRKE